MASASTRLHSTQTPILKSPISNGYATIRPRGLSRSSSIRAKELDSIDVAENDIIKPNRQRDHRRRTRSMQSAFSQDSFNDSETNGFFQPNITSSSSNDGRYYPNYQRSSSIAEDIYVGRQRAKPVKTPTIQSDVEPMYANSSITTSFGVSMRAHSDASSVSSSVGVIRYHDSTDVTDHYQNIKKISRFSLDSLHSSATSKTPEYGTTEEECIALYLPPEGPKRRHDAVERSSFINTSDSYASNSPKNLFQEQKEQDFAASTPQPSYTPPLDTHAKAYYHQKRAPLLKDCKRRMPSPLTLSPSLQSDSGSPTAVSPTAPAVPVRRESLKSTQKYIPKNFQSNSKRLCDPPTPLEALIEANGFKSLQPLRSSSIEVLERSNTSQSLATMTDPDEIVAVPIAMPVLDPIAERRYHTLGHSRVQSLGTSLHRTHDYPLENATATEQLNSYFKTHGGRYYSANYLQSNKSTGDLAQCMESVMTSTGQLTLDYLDPLDFKVGCQTTLRSKPIIPWYELAIKKDFKRLSCPSPAIGMGLSVGCEEKAHVVAAFEQSLSNMTSRLQQLTATAERKDGELTDMRQTIELLRKQSIQAGLTTAHMQSMGVQTQSQNQNELFGSKVTGAQLPLLPDRTTHQQIQTFGKPSGSTVAGAAMNGNGISGIQRHLSSDSMCSVNSIGSNCSGQDKNNKKKKGWLRSSFTKAFSRNAKISKTSRHGAEGNMNGATATTPGRKSSISAELGSFSAQIATPPLTSSPTKLTTAAKTVTLIENAKPIDAIEQDDAQVVEELKRQLREKDLVLTDIRLEALSSASQLESLKETVNKMRAEMMSLKQNNERLQKLVTSRSLAGSEVSLGNAISPSASINESRRYSLADGNVRPPMDLPKRLEEEVEEENVPPAPAPEPPPTAISPTTHIDLTPPPPALEALPSPSRMPAAAVDELVDVTDGKKIAIACYLGQPESFAKYCEEILETDEFYANNATEGPTSEDGNEQKSFPSPGFNEFVIAYTYISGKTTWQNLDYIVRKTFKDYASRIDPGTNLGLNTDSITSYHLGEAKRGPEMGFPELLPCGYIVGNVRTLYICLQGVGSLAFDSLIPRSIVHRYISLLTEHRRLILCGPSGTGKSYLARRLAEFLVARAGRGNPSEAIATFNVDHKSSKELRQYLGHIAEQAAIANGVSELPTVIILDNLHHASALGDVFSCLLSAGPATKLPCIIGTMSQATCNTTNLQLHHNFRWVLTANHMEPVKGFLGRFLRRRLFQLELKTQQPQPELATVLTWLPTVWQHINRFLEIHSSSDVTIGPRLFLSCPLDLKESQVWFTDIWNYHLSPYLVEAVREGVQLYGRRGGAWNDPSVFIRNSYPWPYGPDSVPPLRQINAEDVGLEGIPANSGDNQDPLLNMLMRLQEAANYSQSQDQESDCASLDSNITPDSSAGAEN